MEKVSATLPQGRPQLKSGASQAPKAVSKAPQTPKVAVQRDYRQPLMELFQTLSIAGGMAPVDRIAAQSTIISIHSAELANGLNAAAASNKFVDNGLRWLCGKDGSDAGGLGIIVALASIAPFAYSTYQLWNAPPKKLRDGSPNPKRVEYDAQTSQLAEVARNQAQEYISQAMEMFQAQQLAEAEAEARARADQNGHNAHG